jgi:hypothetical protein
MAALAASAVLFACASSPKGDAWKDIDAESSSGGYAAALAAIDKAQAAKKPLYNEKNQISLELDKGLLEHYAGDAAASSADLEKAEGLIEEAFTKSVSQDVASYIANDNTKEYGGEEYEDIYLNVFNALNKYAQGDVENAAVEVRRITGKLVALQDKYGTEVVEKEGTSDTGATVGAVALTAFLNVGLNTAAQAAGLPGLIIPIPADLFVTKAPVRFIDSALARYISAIIYRAVGSLDSAKQDLDGIKAAADREAAAVAAIGNDQFGAQPDTPIFFNPASLAEELDVPADKGRLNIIAFAGRGPIKEEKVWDLDLTFFPYLQTLQSLATEKNRLTTGNLVLPRLIYQPSNITGVEVSIAGGEPVKLDLLEDIGAGMHAALGAKFKTTYAKTWIRSTIKYAVVEIAGQIAGNKGAPQLAVVAAVAGAKKGVDASERADVRGSRYFPAKAYVGGITLDPGDYDITVKFNGGDTVTKHVVVKASALNLVEAISLK